ncbi:MAG TPA: FtsX-like permease family protein [Myxococcales bacterium]|nr:FtsX-like permease family protein [Myxococcales bacterium]HIK84353.1 FtsX-like permease family protein [Myxococcales bacterium]
MRWRFIAAMIRRELRSASRRFGFYGSCMAIGIAVVVGLHSLREAVDQAVDLRSKELLGADLRLESRDPLSDEVLAAIQGLSALESTELTRLGSMALAERSGRSRLVDLLAIDGQYPLYGDVWTEPARRWADFGSRSGLVYVDSTLLVQLDLEVSDRLRIGGESFEIAAAIVKAPGSFGLQAEMAPRVFLLKSDLDRTGLIQRGSLVSYLRYMKLSKGVVAPWVAEHGTALENARVRIQTVRGYQEDMSEAFGNLTRYLGLVGLAALMLGSIGVAAGVRVFVREKLDTVALLRSIGASPRDVVAIYSGMAIALGLAAGMLGIIMCVPLLWILPSVFGDLLPVEVSLRIGPVGIATGLGLSVWATLLCAMGPIGDLASVAPLQALRRDFASTENDRIMARVLTVVAVIGSLGLAAVWQAGNLRVGLAFALGLMLTISALALAAALMIRVLRMHAPKGLAYWARQGIANLFRPRNHTLPTTIAIGFALFLVATIHLVQRNVLAQMEVDNRPDRPNFILFDVQRDQLEGVTGLLAEHGAKVVDRAPLVSARISGVRGATRSSWLEDETSSRDFRWALQREYRLTYSDTLRESEELIAGQWWTPDAVQETDPRYPVSVERDLAKSLGVEVGDTLRWQIQGVEIDTVVASLRQVDWGRMATNFFVVFPTAALEGAPQSTVLLMHLADEQARAEMQRDLVGRFPNVSALDATLILRSLDSMLGQISVAIRLLSLFTLGTGIAILIAAALAARSERAHEALLLRVLGASSQLLHRIVATEAIILAGLASVVGGLLAAIGSYCIVVFAFEMPFDPPVLDLLGLVLATFAVTALFGGVGVTIAPNQAPQAALRRETV